MANNKIKYYPVNKGDTSLITLTDDSTILIDCNIQEGDKDPNGNSIYNVKKDLLNSIQKRNSIPFLDIFILAHPDEDHCKGFKKNFYTGAPEDYKDSNRINEEIVIDEIWVTSMLFTNELSNDANSLRSEVVRRKRLSGIKKDKRGNRLRMIGNGKDKIVENVTTYLPENEINGLNDKTCENFSLFILDHLKRIL